MDRFWNKVARQSEDGCWLWLGSTLHNGYGQIRLSGKMVKVHRLSLTWAKGEGPPGSHALHACDEPKCVNPSHLRWGTHADNMRDRSARGRSARVQGAKHGRSKLTEAQVLEIRRLYAAGGVTQQELGDAFGVGNAQVSDIVLRKKWAHLEEIS